MTAIGGSVAHRAPGAGERSDWPNETLVVLVASSTLIGCLDLFHSDDVVVEAPTARQVTACNMAVLDRRIGNYVRRHGSVPTTLAVVVFYCATGGWLRPPAPAHSTGCDELGTLV